MSHLTLDDVRLIVQLVAEASDPTEDVTLVERKRILANGLARVVDADVWLWSTFVPSRSIYGDIATTHFLEEGWQHERQRAAAIRALTNPEFNAHVGRPFVADPSLAKPRLLRRQELFPGDSWESIKGAWEPTGLNYCLLFVYPLSDAFSGLGLHRLAHKPDFSDREWNIVHVTLSQVGWLHAHGENQEAGEISLRLSPRERQVLIYLLGGDTQRMIAEKLELSDHTVGDYIKTLHKKFKVRSRAELQAFFYVGRTPDA